MCLLCYSEGLLPPNRSALPLSCSLGEEKRIPSAPANSGIQVSRGSHKIALIVIGKGPNKWGWGGLVFFLGTKEHATEDSQAIVRQQRIHN